MSISLFVNTPAPATGAAQHAVMQDLLAIAELADVCGFERFLVTEHHTASRGATPDPLQLLAAVAARTARIGLGTAAVILGLSNPLRVAEAVAQLDALSGGRVSLGLARGFDKREFAAFGVSQPDSEEFFLGVAAVQQLLSDETLRPRPVGSIPVSVAASSPESYESAGAKGLPVLTNPYFIGRGQFAGLVARYRAAAKDAGSTPHVMAHVIAVAGLTDREATRAAAPVIDEYLRVRSDGRFSFAELHRDRRVAVGSAETVSRLLAEYGDLGVDEVAVNPLVGIADHQLVVQTVELLAPNRLVAASIAHDPAALVSLHGSEGVDIFVTGDVGASGRERADGRSSGHVSQLCARCVSNVFAPTRSATGHRTPVDATPPLQIHQQES